MTKALGGAFLLGPLGVMAGLLGSNQVIITCMKCGNQWEPGREAPRSVVDYLIEKLK